MIRRPPRSTRTDTLFPYTTLFRSLSGGVRYTKETKRAELQNVHVNPGLPLRALQLPVGTQLRGKFKDSNWSPEVTLTSHPTPSQTLYASYKTGYKSAGFSTSAALLSSDPVPGLTFRREARRVGKECVSTFRTR